MTDDWVPLVRRFDTETEWLEARKKDSEIGTILTASDSRAILLEGYANESPLAVYAEKIREDQPESTDNERFAIGHLLEPVMAQVFEMRKKIKLRTDRKPTLRYHRHWPWMAATLDFWYYDRSGFHPVEFKSIDFHGRDEWSEGQVPLKVQVQVQHQLAVTNSKFGWAMAWAGPGQIHLHRVLRDNDFCEALIRKLLEFKHHCDSRTPPPADWTIATERALLRLHPRDNGLAVPLPDEVRPLIDALEHASKQRKAWENIERAHKNAVKAMIGPNTFGVFRDGSGFTWKTQEVKEHMVKAGTKRVLLGPKKLPSDLEWVTQEALKTQRKALEQELQLLGNQQLPEETVDVEK